MNDVVPETPATSLEGNQEDVCGNPRIAARKGDVDAGTYMSHVTRSPRVSICVS